VILIVAGVSGCGKSTVGALLAGQLGWQFADADSFHSEANVAKMRAGSPLTDADREPWLRSLGAWMDTEIAAGRSAVLACSVLKRAYRDSLLDGRPSALVVFLLVTREELDRRLLRRTGHFFPEKLLDSQLDALELPDPDERVLTVLEEGGAADTVAEIIARLRLDGRPSPADAPVPRGPVTGLNLSE
jgi:gluconokinase